MLDINLIWDDIKDVALQHEAEFKALMTLLRTKGYKDVLEIGCHRGGTAKAFLMMGLWVTAIDEVKQPEIEGMLNSFSKFDFILADSKTAVFTEKVDVLHIDGGHNYVDAESDFYRYKQNVRTGGIVAFHDIHPFDGNNHYGCADFYNYLKKSYLHEEIDAHPGQEAWGGYGIIFL